MRRLFIPSGLRTETIAILLPSCGCFPTSMAFDGCDMELFKLLSNEAGAPLFGSTAHSKKATQGRG
jgi:hypothetical protein